MTVDLEFLKDSPYFAGLTPAQLQSVRDRVFERSFDRGEMVSLEGEVSATLYIVVSGVVKIFMTSADGKEQILSIVRPGESFNDVPAFDGGPNPAGARAMGPVLLYGISGDDMKAVLWEHPPIAINVVRTLASRVRHLISLVEDLSFKHVIGRVARILLENVAGEIGSGPRMTQQEMAAMAGTAREVVGRSLKSLEDRGAIRLDRHRIVITDEEALRRIMEPS